MIFVVDISDGVIIFIRLPEVYWSGHSILSSSPNGDRNNKDYNLYLLTKLLI